jgi:hypothetical protein
LSTACGFGSIVSMWLGAPHNQTKITDFARPFSGELALAVAGAAKVENTVGRAKGNAVPARRNARRLGPPHD